MMRALPFVGFGGLTIGCFAAAVADIFPSHRHELERWGSGLLVGSVALLGLAFPFV